MVRAAALTIYAVLAMPVAAQTTTTDCRWIGNIWSCDSRARGPQRVEPVDQAATMKAGAELVPDLAEQELRRRELRLREREMDARERALRIGDGQQAPDPTPLSSSHLNPDGSLRGFDRDLVKLAVSQCKSDLADMAREAPLSESFMWRDKSPELRRDYMIICLAYSQGLTAGHIGPRSE